MDWGAILSGLAQFGGMGLLAAALLLLHREAIQAFRDELRLERELTDKHFGQLFASQQSTTSTVVTIFGEIKEMRDDIKEVKGDLKNIARCLK